MRGHVLVLSLVASAVASCGKPAQPQEAEAAAKKVESGAEAVPQAAQPSPGTATSPQVVQGLPQITHGFPQGALASAKAVDFEELKALVPDVEGWTRSDTKGEQLTVPVSYSRAQARYRKDESRIELEIVDTALSQLLLAPLSVFLASGYSEQSDDGFKRAVKVGGQPGLEDWNAKSRRGEVTALAGSRFVVKATGHDVDNLDPVRKVVESIDLSKFTATAR